ncbi:MAG TPA: hypothetical protein VFT74_14630, partial [Isosphaeraceae bacterium]|nr:hypothetical protein [Isosphaeraceae bacterium]
VQHVGGSSSQERPGEGRVPGETVTDDAPSDEEPNTPGGAGECELCGRRVKYLDVGANGELVCGPRCIERSYEFLNALGEDE